MHAHRARLHDALDRTAAVVAPSLLEGEETPSEALTVTQLQTVAHCPVSVVDADGGHT